MHQRTWLSLITLPLVAGFTYPMVAQRLPMPGAQSAPSQAQDPLAGLADIQDVLERVRDFYVDVPDLGNVLSGGIQAALERANSQNGYLSPDDLMAPDPGKATAGLRLLKRGPYGYVVAVHPGSAAAGAGLLPSDVVTKVDGKSVGLLNAWQLERALHGAPGSRMNLSVIASTTGLTRQVDLVRQVEPRQPIQVRREAKALVVAFPDFQAGRAAEFKAVAASMDRQLPLVVDLRSCQGGTLAEAAQVAGLLGLEGPLVTVQVRGQADRSVAIPPGTLGFAKVAGLGGFGTAGPSETLFAALKAQGRPTFGSRTASMGIGMTRVMLQHGGAVDIVNERWITPGGLKLDRDLLRPEKELHGLRPDEDPVPRVLDLLAQPDAFQLKPAPTKAPGVAWFFRPLAPVPVRGTEVA